MTKTKKKLKKIVRDLYKDVRAQVNPLTDLYKEECDILEDISRKLASPYFKPENFIKEIDTIIEDIRNKIRKIVEKKTKDISDHDDREIEISKLTEQIIHDLQRKLITISGFKLAKILLIMLGLGLAGGTTYAILKILKKDEKVEDAIKRAEKERQKPAE